MNVKSLVCNSNGLACEVVATLSRRWPSSKESESLFRRCCRSIEQLSNFFCMVLGFFQYLDRAAREAPPLLENIPLVWSFSLKFGRGVKPQKLVTQSAVTNHPTLNRKDCYLKKPLIIYKNFVFLRTFLLTVNRSRNSFRYSQYANPLANLWFSICKV